MMFFLLLVNDIKIRSRDSLHIRFFTNINKKKINKQKHVIRPSLLYYIYTHTQKSARERAEAPVVRLPRSS